MKFENQIQSMFTTISKSYISDIIRISSNIYHNTGVRDVEGEKGIKRFEERCIMGCEGLTVFGAHFKLHE